MRSQTLRSTSLRSKTLRSHNLHGGLHDMQICGSMTLSHPFTLQFCAPTTLNFTYHFSYTLLAWARTYNETKLSNSLKYILTFKFFTITGQVLWRRVGLANHHSRFDAIGHFLQIPFNSLFMWDMEEIFQIQILLSLSLSFCKHIIKYFWQKYVIKSTILYEFLAFWESTIQTS